MPFEVTRWVIRRVLIEHPYYPSWVIRRVLIDYPYYRLDLLVASTTPYYTMNDKPSRSVTDYDTVLEYGFWLILCQSPCQSVLGLTAGFSATNLKMRYPKTAKHSDVAERGKK